MKKRNFIKSTGMILASTAFGRTGSLLAATVPQEVHLQEMPDRPWADPASLVTTIAAGTIAVPNVDEMVSTYKQGLEYVEHWRGTISEETARFWGTPAMAGRAAAVLGPPDLKTGLIRFVELGDDFKYVPSHTTLGWTALEVRVRNVDAMVEQLAKTTIKHTGGPADLKFGSGPPTLRAAQFEGPAGEAIYFTQDLQFDRAKIIGRNNVGGILLQTLVAVPYVPTRDLYLKTLAMQLRVEASFPRANVAETFGVDKSIFYKMASVRAPQYCAIQVDEYPDITPARPAAPGCLPPAACMSTLAVRDLNLVASALEVAGVPFTRTETAAMLPGFGGRALACRGYSGEFIEFVES